MKRLAVILLLLSHTLWAVEPMRPACQQAFIELNRHIEQNSTSLSQAELETSYAADAVRLQCDGTAHAYEQSIRQIAARFIPPPKTPNAGLSAQTEGLLSLALMIALIVSSSSAVTVIGGGNGLIIAPQ
ncbi:hypothetical protein NT239_07890 [Chitinibacter sp. SCUT-21]|uniref:hypothetical protein n=1 Tax=Chitinibacter sp. SCUT-21 TaxID=2970891 RepID=UPI0035A6B55B